MKKFLLLMSVIALTMSTQAFAADTTTENTPVKAKTECKNPCDKMHTPPMGHPDKAAFEKRLKLTDEQKADIAVRFTNNSTGNRSSRSDIRVLYGRN